MNLPMKRPVGPRRRWDSVYSTLMVFLISVIVAAALLTAAAYALLLVVGMLANPYARLLTMPILMAFFITTLAAGMGKGKLNPINDLVEAGYAVVMISSEMTEIIGMCDRAVVIKEGYSVGELPREELTEINLIRYAMGVQNS